MSTEICPSCNAKVKRGAQFCQECGTELNESQSKRILTEVSKQDEFIGYIQITSVVEIALGILILILGLLLLIFSLLASEDAFRTEYAQYFVNYLKIVLMIIGVLMILLGAIAIYFGTKMFQLKQIGRIGTMLVSALVLIFLPFGTIFGVFALYLLIQPQTIEIFRIKSKIKTG